jgi:glycosyltransferase involved in cell wall biosynthesis
MMDTAAQPPTARRILFVLDHYHPHVGGAETLFRELARGLVAQGRQVTIVTRRDDVAQAPRELFEGVEIHRVSAPRWSGRLGYLLAALPTAWRAARAADVIHVGGYGSLLPAWIAGRLTGRPVVATVFEVMAEQMQMLANVSPPVALCLRLFERILLALPFARYACISEYTRTRLLQTARVAPDRAIVIYPAVDYEFWNPDRHAARPLRRELGLSESTRVALFYGRPGASKGIDTLVDAIEHLGADRDRPCHTVMILAHEPAAGRKWVQDEIRERGLDSLVTILSPTSRSELPSYLLAADCIVIPSLSEGFGYSAVEAATLGCPVVASSGHAVEEVVGPYVRLVPPRDPLALAAAIGETACSDAPRRYAPARYTIDAHVLETMKLHEQAVASRKPPVRSAAAPRQDNRAPSVS